MKPLTKCAFCVNVRSTTTPRIVLVRWHFRFPCSPRSTPSSALHFPEGKAQRQPDSQKNGILLPCLSVTTTFPFAIVPCPPHLRAFAPACPSVWHTPPTPSLFESQSLPLHLSRVASSSRTSLLISLDKLSPRMLWNSEPL